MEADLFVSLLLSKDNPGPGLDNPRPTHDVGTTELTFQLSSVYDQNHRVTTLQNLIVRPRLVEGICFFQKKGGSSVV